MNMAVVGHVEWIEFLRVEAVPGPGDIALGDRDMGGAGGRRRRRRRRARAPAGEATLFCLLGADELGQRARRELEAASVRIHAAHERRARSGEASSTSTTPASGRSP